MSSEITVKQAELSTLAAQQQYSKMVASSSIIPRAYQNKPADVFVAIQYGMSIGLSPIASLQDIDVIQGKPTLSAQTMLAIIHCAGHAYHIKTDEQNMSVTCTITRNGENEPFSVTRDMKWAQQMGLTSKDNYKRQPLTMLQWRAVSACARLACPELFAGIGGAYTADELHDMDTPVEATVVEDDADAWPASKVHLVNRVDGLISMLGITKPQNRLRVYELLHEGPVEDPLADIDESELAMWVQGGDEFLENRIKTLVQQAKERKHAHEEAQQEAETQKEEA